ncbi:hypothetical protein HMPREF0083_03607 [Aneurinibacillus aneurinilyticus ATCC 12856]|uniref:Uncharacterized protein n=1 Tax=Aneurinibacillus aneurinilyticus ATCC 12856 TaxID=649747 RepID=U1X036_ANEAE|nr:hypothetical protein HMPREF0083_03607 [Aneurinibacillus aneurinilyticus ATCC 12856]
MRKKDVQKFLETNLRISTLCCLSAARDCRALNFTALFVPLFEHTLRSCFSGEVYKKIAQVLFLPL